jgi:hypothetical protein
MDTSFAFGRMKANHNETKQRVETDRNERVMKREQETN